MAWPEKLKLNKQLTRTITAAGYAGPKEVQQKTLARIFGGQDTIVAGPKGCGKTTTYVLSVLNRLKYNNEGVPLVLILVPTKEDVLEVTAKFEELAGDKQALIVGLYATPGTEAQMNALADGADIVVATPDRARAIYLKLGLNLNRIELLIIDDADLMVKQGFQLPVTELANSITKCQHLVFTEVLHDRLNKMIAPFMQSPALVEIEEVSETEIETCEQVLYHVPNFITKLNLLNLFMQDDELFTKTIVFVNTRHTAEKLYKSLQNRLRKAVAIYKPWSIELSGVQNIADLTNSPALRVLIIVNNTDPLDLAVIPFLLHFELPEEPEIFIKRVTDMDAIAEETVAITFTTDLELATVKKIEQAIGNKIPQGDLPDGLVIETERKASKTDEGQTAKAKNGSNIDGIAFHQKKAENSKTYNYGAGVKAKMSNKKKH